MVDNIFEEPFILARWKCRSSVDSCRGGHFARDRVVQTEDVLSAWNEFGCFETVCSMLPKFVTCMSEMLLYGDVVWR
jgi:hypothetical protein